RAARGRARYIVLATDGAPTCSPASTTPACECTRYDLTGRPLCDLDPAWRARCDDDDRTVTAIATAAAEGVPVYVIGITGPNLTGDVVALNRMAEAGGRPRTGAGATDAFYRVHDAGDLVVAFDDIQRSIDQCSLLTPARPDQIEMIDLVLDGVTIP